MDERYAKILAEILADMDSEKKTAITSLTQNSEDEPDFSSLVEITLRYQKYPTPAPEKRFRYAARSRILTTLIDPRPVTFYGRVRHILQITNQLYTRRLAMSIILIVTLVLSLFGGGTVYASQGAIPGDLLYSLKVNIEELRLNTASEEGKSELYLQFASERVEEVKALIEEEKFDEIGVALKGFESRAAGVRQIMPETEMEDPLLVHFEVLNGLLDRVPYQAQEAIKHAITVSTWNKEIGETSRPEELPAGELPVELPVELPAVVPDTVPPVDVPPVEPP
jgi:hypothetical protein